MLSPPGVKAFRAALSKKNPLQIAVGANRTKTMALFSTGYQAIYLLRRCKAWRQVRWAARSRYFYIDVISGQHLTPHRCLFAAAADADIGFSSSAARTVNRWAKAGGIT